MKLLLRSSLLLVCFGLSATAALFAQRYGFDTNPYGSVDNERAEFGWSRLRYNATMSNRYFGYGGYGTWSTDYPKADRTFLRAFQRLTRINAKSTEQVVDLSIPTIFTTGPLFMRCKCRTGRSLPRRPTACVTTC